MSVRAVVDDFGGFKAFADRMGAGSPSMVRMVVSGKRRPSPEMMAAMVRASDGRISEKEIIAITGVDGGRVPGDHVDAHWDADPDERRDWIARRAAEAARRQRLANERAEA